MPIAAVLTQSKTYTVPHRQHFSSVIQLSLEPEFVGSNPAEAVEFFGRPENPQYAFLRRGSKIICPHVPALRHVKEPSGFS